MIALTEYPRLIKAEKQGHLKLFPPDVLARAEGILKAIDTTGAYSHSQGILPIRESIAKFIAERDETMAPEPKSIFMTNGASDGISRILECLITCNDSGIMIPIPQYPLYSAAIDLLGGSIVPYYLYEDQNWTLKVNNDITIHKEVIIMIAIGE